MAELADAADSKSADRKVVGVRPPLPAPIKSTIYNRTASAVGIDCAQTVPKLDFYSSIGYEGATCRNVRVRVG